MTDAEELSLGRNYQVTMEDCCVRAEFTSILMERRYDQYADLDELVFRNGVHIKEWGQVKFEEVG